VTSGLAEPTKHPQVLGHSLINPAGSTSPELTRSAAAVRLSTGVRESFE
jgi:hypothetical protein